MQTVALHRGAPRDNYINAVAVYKLIAVDLETAFIKQHYLNPHYNKKDKDGDVQIVTIETAKTTSA
jgi:hypothetical protein